MTELSGYKSLQEPVGVSKAHQQAGLQLNNSQGFAEEVLTFTGGVAKKEHSSQGSQPLNQPVPSEGTGAPETILSRR